MTGIDSWKNRRIVIQILIISVFMIYIIRLLYLQVINKDYAELAKDRAYRKVTVYPDRGPMYDRTGKLIVFNEPIYNLMVIPYQVKQMDTMRFCELMQIDKEAFITKLQDAKKYSSLHASVFISQISAEDFGKIEEFLYEFKGFFPEIRTVRKYPYPTAAHVLGYVTEVDSNDIKRSNGYYKPGDYIGKSGVEKYYEELLRGQRGYKNMVVDAYNRIVGSLGQGENDLPVVAGKTLTLTLDIELQQYAELLMQNKRGAIVAIEPSTGEILAMVSSPSYDPNMLVGSKRTKNYASLVFDPMRPLNNRALTGYYPPGSQYKPLMALVALQEGTLTPDQGYGCGGGYRMAGHTVGCHNHPFPANVIMSIQHSCNAYYCYVLKHFIDDNNATTAEGLVKLNVYLASFGIGVKTGVDLPGEKSGNIPDPEDYDKIYGKNRWRSSNFITLGIGQDQMIVTPLQNANMMAAIANGGYWYAPHVLKYADGEDSILNALHLVHQTMVDKQYFDLVTEGLSMVVKAGTARVAQIDSIEVCGKTGTAENPHGKDHSQFSGFAPRNNPKIAIAVLVENSGFGATWAAPIASLLMEYYLKREINPKRKYLEDRLINADLIHEIKTPIAAVIKTPEGVNPDIP
ncbi:MAG: penicillin-binding protein 2 [Chitinophagales bacterium]|nr:penicillin-binding protein 2 [Bacteroidota bacterium]MBP7399972.1 penicillin-binding protein 2 [Chitinophagales bacterium]MBK8486845.1 penicillin-binding protein 2 [Bacteroidota bacterium]MBK8681257.1 penicillin-binding protein 2 [Bacteroidota bacterium]MBP8755233.1 penicillin-binding protein 2 [Chitinophagales bacterium]